MSKLRELLLALFSEDEAIVNKVDLLFRRKTSRYAPKGTISSNKGYLQVARDPSTGRFKSINK